MRVWSWKNGSKSPGQSSRRKAAEMSGHNAPGKARSQMTKLQNATDKRTPAKPTNGSVSEGISTLENEEILRSETTETSVSVAFITGILTSFPL